MKRLPKWLRVAVFGLFVSFLPLALLVGTVVYLRPHNPADAWKHCQFSYLHADGEEIARRLAARAQARKDSMLSDEEWWRRAKLLPKQGVVDCGSFRATIAYAVDTPRVDLKAMAQSVERIVTSERIEVTGDREAYRKFREDTRQLRASPFYIDLSKWESAR